MDKGRLREVFDSLYGFHGPQHWWPAQSPFEVMVGAVLTQNTAWTNVERALERLTARIPLHPQAILDLPLDELARLLQPSGYFNVKARRLRAFCEGFVAQGGMDRLAALETCELRRRLLAMAGIGPETADDMLLYAFARPVFVVDAYTRRVFARLGLLAGHEGYETIRAGFESALGPDVPLYNEYHALIVRHGKYVCRTRPRCCDCCLRRQCPVGDRDESGDGAGTHRLRDMANQEDARNSGVPRRAVWPKDFPAVDIHASESLVKHHRDYAAAKTGDAAASVRLVQALVNPTALQRLEAYRHQSPIVLPVHGIEGVSVNTIPLALGVYLSETLGFTLCTDVVQISKAGHTGAPGWWRLRSPALFSGRVEAGRTYILVDDFIGMGGTFANLRGHVEARGGRVLRAQALTGKPRSATLALQDKTLTALRNTHGDDLETWWRAELGFGFEALTESEALYLLRAENAETVRRRLAEAAHEGDRRSDA